jgi:hypothetical protein
MSDPDKSVRPKQPPPTKVAAAALLFLFSILSSSSSTIAGTPATATDVEGSSSTADELIEGCLLVGFSHNFSHFHIENIKNIHGIPFLSGKKNTNPWKIPSIFYAKLA